MEQLFQVFFVHTCCFVQLSFATASFMETFPDSMLILVCKYVTLTAGPGQRAHSGRAPDPWPGREAASSSAACPAQNP